MDVGIALTAIPRKMRFGTNIPHLMDDEEDQARMKLQGDQPYFILIKGNGTEKMTQSDRGAFESAFRAAFDRVCSERGWQAVTVVHAHCDFNEDVLDPRSGGPGFFDDLHDLAVAALEMKPPRGAYFDCDLNYGLLVQQSQQLRV